MYGKSFDHREQMFVRSTEGLRLLTTVSHHAKLPPACLQYIIAQLPILGTGKRGKGLSRNNP